MVNISPYKIPALKNRMIALFIHYILKIVFIFSRLLILKPLRENADLPVNKIKKVLIVRADGIGDIIRSVPAFKAIRKVFSHSNITLLAATWSKDLVDVMPTFDEVIYFDCPWIVKSEKNKILRLIKAIKELRKKRFDLSIDLRGDFRNNILMYLCGIKYRVGYDITGCGFLLTHVVPYDLRWCHETVHTIKLLEVLGADETDPKLELWYTEGDKRFAERMLNSLPPLRVAIHPATAKWPLKNWTSEGFAEISNRLIKEHNAELVFLGNSDDLMYIENIVKLIGSKDSVRVFAGRASLRQTLALINECDLFLGIDSGPMHLADALGKPIVVLFGPGNEKLFSPSNSEYTIIKKDIGCGPCSMSRCKFSSNICMEAITVEEVWEAIEMRIKTLKNIMDYSFDEVR